MNLLQAIKELKKEPDKREIRKKEQLVQIYLTISTILTALKQHSETVIIQNSTIIREASITSVEKLQNSIQSTFFLIFLLAIIVYYMYLGERSKPAKRAANLLALCASICFSIIFTSYSYPFEGYWIQNSTFFMLTALVAYLVMLSLQVSISFGNIFKLIGEIDSEKKT